jgi:hypothetical protein
MRLGLNWWHLNLNLGTVIENPHLKECLLKALGGMMIVYGIEKENVGCIIYIVSVK